MRLFIYHSDQNSATFKSPEIGLRKANVILKTILVGYVLSGC